MKTFNRVYLAENSNQFKFNATKYQGTFSSSSILVINPSKLKSDIPMILNKTNPAIIQYYNPVEDKIFANKSIKPYPKLSRFIQNIPTKLLKSLDGIVEVYPNDYLKRGWLLFFNINSKPMFCYTKKTVIFP